MYRRTHRPSVTCSTSSNSTNKGGGDGDLRELGTVEKPRIAVPVSGCACWIRKRPTVFQTLRTHRAQAIGLARAYAKATIFAINNPESAVRMLYEIYPTTRPTGKDEATAIRDDVRVLQARIANWKLEKGGVSRWGESSEANYAAYLDFFLKWEVIGAKVPVQDVITNELIDEINRFDSAKIVADARANRSR